MKKISLESMINALSHCEDCVIDLSNATEEEIAKKYRALNNLGLLSDKPPANLRREEVEHLTPDELVSILRKSESEFITIEILRRHINSGAPVNPDGTLDLISYAAWLVKSI